MPESGRPCAGASLPEATISTAEPQVRRRLQSTRPSPVLRRHAARPVLMAVLPPMALTTALGLWGIRRQSSMWGDEAVTWQLAQRGVPHIWRTAQHIDLVHALYYTLMHGVFAVFGDGLLTLRLPSMLAMSLTAAGVGLLGLRLVGPGRACWPGWSSR